MKGNLTDIIDLVLDLGWDFDRMSQSGQQIYNKLCYVLDLEQIED